MRNLVLKVICSSLDVMKGVCHRKIYPLIGEIITRDLAVGISGSKDQIEFMTIWHWHLGHMS